jgi:hypothetical protein
LRVRPLRSAALPPAAAYGSKGADVTTSHEFYLTRASEAQRDADAASLVNVRDRCLRAASAWQAMADRAARTDRSRAEVEARKAAVAVLAE